MSEEEGCEPERGGLAIAECIFTCPAEVAHRFVFHRGDSDRDEVNATFIQPFVSYTTKTFTTFGFNTETTYDWEHEQGTVPLNWTVQQLLKIGTQPLAVQLGARYYAEKPAGGPDWDLRFAMTLLFPK